MSEMKKRFRMEPHWIVWSVGWVLYTIASDFVASQSVVDILDRLALVAFATGTVMAWQSGRRGMAWMLGTLTIARAALGAPGVSQRPATHLWVSGVLLGFIVLMMLLSFWAGRRQRTAQELAP